MTNQVKKRDGRLVPFSVALINTALHKAFSASGVELKDDSTIPTLSATILDRLEFPTTVETIQDVTIAILGEKYPQVASNYNTYRTERTKVREKTHKLFTALSEIITINSQGSDLKRENANVNGDTAMGTMLQVGAEASKAYYLNNILKETHAHAHATGYIHIHDLDFYSLTLTCCQIPLRKLLHDGFNTGHGFLRPPTEIRSYAALAAIAIQSNQNDQHGGQSVADFDYAMGDGVGKTFHKLFINEVKEFSAYNTGYPLLTNILPTQYNLHDWGYLTTNTEYIEGLLESIDLAEHTQYLSVLLLLRRNVIKKTIEATDQAMEAFIHNLNSMHSRAGAQVPFSSINYGMDIRPEAQIAISSLLLATQKGLGKGETPIFPIQVFRVKSGINLEPGTPNHELLKLACETTAKRLFPNFSFQDAPFNLAYYKEGKPETEIGYMGCAAGNEMITYKMGGKVYVEGLRRAYERIASTKPTEAYGVTQYVNTAGTGISIYDSHQGGFVGMRKILKNPDRKNWQRVTLSDGRTLDLTADHPLPVLGKGRTKVSELALDDRIPVVFSQAVEPTIPYNNAWLHGLALVDSSYAVTTIISLGDDEQDIVERAKSELASLGYDTKVTRQARGDKGNYRDLCIKGDQVTFRKQLTTLFGGVAKAERRVPIEIFNAPRNNRLEFLAGMVDGDGYNNRSVKDKGVGMRVQIGSTNKELAYGQLLLAQSLGIPAKMYANHYKGDDAIRYRVEFGATIELLSYLTSAKKKVIPNKGYPMQVQTPQYAKVCEIVKLEDYNQESYDVETDSDRFDLSGISSHNCRTRVIGNTYDTSKEITYGRGNLSFTSINLPRLAIESKGDISLFFTKLTALMELVTEQLLHRMQIQAQRSVKNFPFLMGQHIWLGSDKLNPEDNIAEIMKHGTLSIGFIGLAEALTSLLGTHHGQNAEAQALGLRIVGAMRRFTDDMAQQYKLNFSLIATPAEGLSGRFVAIDKKIMGVITGVTDKPYYTNSFHIPVGYAVGMTNKLALEAPYHALTNAGHISYVETDGLVTNNPKAILDIIKRMHQLNIGYGSINHPLDSDPECGYSGVIEGQCPKCGREPTDAKPFTKLRRITGYLVGSLERFNTAKSAEVSDRLKHKS